MKETMHMLTGVADDDIFEEIRVGCHRLCGREYT